MLANNLNINPRLKASKSRRETKPIVEDVLLNTPKVDPHSMLDPKMPQPSELGEAIKQQNFNNMFKLDDYNVSAAYSELYTNVSENRGAIIRETERMRGFYLFDTIVTQLVEDALTPEISTNEVLEISYDDENESSEVAKEIQELVTKIDFDQLAQDVAPNLVRIGEYTLKNIFSKDGDDPKTTGGLMHVRDCVEQEEVIAITQDGEIKGYLEMNASRRQLVVNPPKQFTKFILSGDRVRVNLKKHIPSTFLKSKEAKKLMAMLPKHVRVGKSIIYPVLPKIKELELLEKLVPATKLAKLSSGTIVGMQLPESFEITEALNATKRIEGMLNNKLAIDDNIKEITVQAIMSSAGRLKVLPVFGDKGSLSKLDYKSDEPDDLLGAVQELRQVILDSIGIPYELIYKSEGDSKSEILKRYAKYLRKLKNIQRAITEGIKHIIYVHLFNKNIEFEVDKVKVEFRNKLVEIDNLDKLEHMDVTVSLLGNLDGYVRTISEEESLLKGFVNRDAYKEYVKSQLGTIGLSELINDEWEEPETEDDFGSDDDPFGDSGDVDGEDPDAEDAVDGDDAGDEKTDADDAFDK